MAQTANGMSMKNCKVELSTNGTVWTDASGHSNEVAWDGAEKQTESTFTFDGKGPIITQGKQDAASLTIKVVYTEGASDPAQLAQSAYDNDTPLYARWSPRNGAQGVKRYVSSAGIVKKPPYPAGASNAAGAVLVDIVLECTGITQETVP